MIKSYFSKINILFFLMALGLLFCFQASIDKPKLTLSAQEKRISFSTDFFNFFNLGQKRLISSYLWIETLIKADHEHFDESEGQSSWLFYRFKSIINLDHRFYEAYLFGAQYLSIIKDEPIGASRVLDRGLQVYPEDYWLHYYAAYNEYFELGNIEKAKGHYQRLISHPKSRSAPAIHSLYTRLLSDQSDREDAFEVMKSIYDSLSSESLKQAFWGNLYRLRAQIDLECLNSSQNKEECRKVDLNGEPYQYIDGQYQSNK